MTDLELALRAGNLANKFPYAPYEVVEVAFLKSVDLPVDTKIARKPSGPWTLLFDV